MRILQLCAVDFTLKHFLLPLVDYLEGQGHEVICVCSQGSNTEELKKQGYRIHSVPISRSMNLFSHLRSLMRLYRFIRNKHFDVVHVHTPIAALIGRIAARMAKVPIIIYTAHGFYFHGHMKPSIMKIHINLERLGAKFCDFIFTQSEEDRLAAIQHKIIDEKNIKTIGNGVDIGHFSPERITQQEMDRLKARLGIETKKVVAMMGRLVREKGYREFFSAAAEIRKERNDVTFLIIGGALESDYDDFSKEIRQLIGDDCLQDAVCFTGLVSDASPYLAIADIFCLPSYREGMPRSIIEAMAMAKPVIASNIRGCREEVVDGETGFLVPRMDSKQLAERIGFLLDNPERAISIGKQGRARAEELYDEKRVLLRQYETIRRLAGEKLGIEL